MADLVGQQLGNYTLTRLLGRGGFADVYLGEHQYLKSQAAIKILQTRLSSEDSLDGFLKEAQTIARLTHPNIVRVLDFGVAEETPYLVMEYAPNGTLRQSHPRGTQLPPSTVLTYVKQVADALQYAHDERLIHRDVKPENMLLGRRNEVLLSDFGIALTAQSSHSQRTQEAIGTVAYMAPEQIQGKPRPASDQYSLAVVIYEWLSGQQLFQGSFTELCTQHMFASPPPLHEKIATITPEVENVLLKALDKDPHRRFESIQLFAQALELASQGKQTIQVQSTASTASSISSQTSYATTPMNEDDKNGPSKTGQPSYTTIPVNSSDARPAAPAVPGPSPLFRTPAIQKTPTPSANPQGTAAESITQANTVAPQMTLHSDRTIAQTGPASARAPLPQPGPQTGQPSSPTPPGRYNNAPFGQASMGQIQPQQQPYQQPGQSFPGQYPPLQPSAQPFGQPNQFNAGQAYGQGQLSQQQMIPPQTHQQRPVPTQEEYTPPAPRARQEEQHASSARARQETAESRDRESEDDLFSGLLGEWKWPILATIGGIILFCIIHSFYPEIWRYNVPIVLAVPLFFGGAFGPWVGLLVGLGGALLSPLFYPGNDALYVSMFHLLNRPYEWWIPVLLYTLTGLAAGLSMLKKRRFPTISSAIRATMLVVIALAVSIGYLLYQAHELQRFLRIGLIGLLAIAVGGALLIIYSIVARLIDTAA